MGRTKCLLCRGAGCYQMKESIRQDKVNIHTSQNIMSACSIGGGISGLTESN
jgi:hypothetical protein